MKAIQALNMLLMAHAEAAYFGVFSDANGFNAQDRANLQKAVQVLSTATFAEPAPAPAPEAPKAPQVPETDCGCPEVETKEK